MCVFVTGSAGHLGEALIRVLEDRGIAAHGIDIKPSPYTDRVGSICDREFVRRHLVGARAVIHAATLHKPHVATHENQAFVDTNVTGTLVLLEESAKAGVGAFVFTSTTSAFGLALSVAPGSPASWITEDVVPIPKNIYGVTKLAAEGLVKMFARRHRLPAIILRTSRFFPEVDDDPAVAAAYSIDNVQANELLYRRADIADVVDAHLLALDRAPELNFGRYIVSATTPFDRSDAAELGVDAPSVIRRIFSEAAARYAERGWSLPPRLDRVYDNSLARNELGLRPQYNFAHVLACLECNVGFRSPLAMEVGSKGYHDGFTCA